MKKHLIAAAVAAAVAAPVMAQNVTFYGILDQGYVNNKTETTVLGVGATSKTSATVAGSNYTNQRWGVRGEEDLGGGLKASFNYEVGIIPAGGTVDGTDSNQAGVLGTLRQANIGVSGGFGTLRLGQMNTQAENAYGVGDVGGGNNFIGRLYTSGTRLSNARSARLIEYTTPTMSGFSAAVQYGKGSEENTAATTATTKDSRTEMGLGLRYSAGALNIMLGYLDEKGEDNSVKTAKFKETVIGANYNFGPARVFFTYLDNKASSDAVPGVSAKTDNMEIGVSVPLGATTVNASFYKGDIDATGLPKVDVDGFQIAGLYALSKRTMAYAVYGSTDSSTTGLDIEGTRYGVGIRHSF